MDFTALRFGALSSAPPAGAGIGTDAPRRLDLRFTGSGSEYWRIWLVNLLLTLVTLTLYAPFAKVRRLRWQYANTLVDGQALGFHGDPWKMLRGHLLILVFGACYLGAGQFSALAGLVAAGALAALWPALWQASLRFRLANTSWRGVRLHFSGTVGGAYLALAPMLLPAALFLAALVWPAEPDEPVPWVLGLSPLLVGLLFPWVAFRARRYQHEHYHWAGQTTRLETTLGAFYGLWLRAGMISGLPLFVAGLLAAVLLPALGQRSGGMAAAGVLLTGLLAVLAYLLALIVGQAYLISRQQNLVWGSTRSDALQFHSALAMRELWPLLGRNLLFTALTLGLYWPFAWVQLLRMRLQAVSVQAQGDPATWVATLRASEGSAAGEAAGDLLDIDVGL
ncbi:MAG: DUF898 family protein [Burkholderiaceae bacterium]|nr:DUF898 family protein [Burkholderiaceae bacterium]